MALSRIWSAFVFIAIAVAGWKTFVLGDVELFSRMITGENGMMETAATAVSIALKLIGIMAFLWASCALPNWPVG